MTTKIVSSKGDQITYAATERFGVVDFVLFRKSIEEHHRGVSLAAAVHLDVENTS
jgi:hypothetical protein